MAACCSSTCATITASPNAWPIRTSPAFKDAEKLRSEWVVRIDGKVRRRPEGTDNPELPTGTIEVYVSEIEVLGPAAELPLPVFGEQEYPEDIRLKYRFLDLRREKLHQNIMTRGAVVDSMRKRMKEQGFFEFQTPILTAFGISMHRYRSHTCGALRDSHIGETVRLSGWCHACATMAALLFIDLRDHYGLTQIVVDPDSPAFKTAETVRVGMGRSASTARCKARTPETVNAEPADRRDRGLRHARSRCCRRPRNCRCRCSASRTIPRTSA